MTETDRRIAVFESQLKGAGLRMTQQRRLILRVLAGREVADFVGDHRPFDDANAPGSPEPPAGVFG